MAAGAECDYAIEPYLAEHPLTRAEARYVAVQMLRYRGSGT